MTIVTTNGMSAQSICRWRWRCSRETDLATQITERIIPLDTFVPEGLEPLARHEVLGKVLVSMQENRSNVASQQERA